MGTLWNENQDQVRAHQCSESWCWNNGAVEAALYCGIWTAWHKQACDLGPLRASFASSVKWGWKSLGEGAFCKLWSAVHRKAIMLFAKSECSLLCMVHKTGLLLETFVGVGGGGEASGKYRSPVSPQTSWIRILWEDLEVIFLTGALGNYYVFGKLHFVHKPQRADF